MVDIGRLAAPFAFPHERGCGAIDGDDVDLGLRALLGVVPPPAPHVCHGEIQAARCALAPQPVPAHCLEHRPHEKRQALLDCGNRHVSHPSLNHGATRPDEAIPEAKQVVLDVPKSLAPALAADRFDPLQQVDASQPLEVVIQGACVHSRLGCYLVVLRRSPGYCRNDGIVWGRFAHFLLDKV